ncbi:hypothetical protein C8R45DRAFT_928984 [Mycena sanguinolenta]|nr:hypothetical protein C8R45DRAFT_928984 [Mycena sanguinolenta]
MIALYVHVLRKRGIGQKCFLAFATIALFALCTAHCVLVLAASATMTSKELGLIRGGISEELVLVQTLSGLSVAANVIYVTAKCIYRCYAIWDSQIKIILFPILLKLSIAGIGYFSAVSLASDTSFSGFVVGRIWVLACTARQVFGAQMANTYHTSFLPVAETWDFSLESGALYLCGGIAFISLGVGGPFTYDVTFSDIVLVQLVGIAPTIIAVRVALGQSIKNMDSFCVLRSHMCSSVHHKVIATAVDLVHDEVLYNQLESIKVEAV